MGLPFNPRRLRWLVLAGMLVVLGATLRSFLVQRESPQQFRPAPSKMAPDISQQTQAFSLSKTLGDNTLYTVQAKEVTHFKEKVVLHGVTILLYGKEGQRRDRIESKECEYNPATGSLVIPGEVEMKLGVPLPSLSQAPPGQAPDSVSITTSGLSFDQNTGLAATDREVRFWFSRGRGTSQGAIYDPQSQQLTLKADVQFILQELTLGTLGSVPGQGHASEPAPGSEETLTRVRADSLRFRRGEAVIYLSGSVELTQGTQKLQAGNSAIFLDDQYRARKAVLEGGVLARDQSPGHWSEVRSQRGVLELTALGKLKALQLEEEVGWVSSSESRREGHAERMELFFAEPTGLLERMVAVNNVQMVLRHPPSDALAQDGRPSSTAPPIPPPGPQRPTLGAGTQILSAPQAEMLLASDGETLRRVVTQPPSTLELLSSRPGEDPWRITGENFAMDFDPRGNLSQFSAEGNVRVSSQSPEQPAQQRVSTSDHLVATVDPRLHSVTQIQQSGHYRYQDPEKQGRAEQAAYSAAGDTVVLQGQAVLWDSTGKLSAKKIVLNNATGDLQAEGSLSTTYFPKPSPGAQESEPIHVVAERLQYDAAAGKAQYQGRVHLWRGTNLLEADWVELDRRQSQLEARKGVYTIFPQPPGGPAKAGAATLSPVADSPGRRPVLSGVEGQPVEIRSERLVYKQEEQKAVYQGGVQMRNASATVNSGELEVFFSSQGKGASSAGSGQIERAVANSNVVVLDSGRKATGERAEYFLEEGKMRLFGNPATILDPSRGSTQGVRLTYLVGDDRMLVEGEPGLPTETRRQVHR